MKLSIIVTLLSCMVMIACQNDQARLTSFTFLPSDNVTVLETTKAVFFGNEIFVQTPYITDATALVPRFTTTGTCVSVNGVPQTSGVDAQDFSSGVIDYVVTAPNGESRTYHISVLCSALPVVFINTPNAAPVTRKDQWMDDVSIRIIGTDGSIDYQSDALQIRGRGNSTWRYPKKPYALKLESGSTILGMPGHKRWILLANWLDRTLLRNHIAFGVSRLTSLPYTVNGRFVEVVFNGKHVGNYYLCEQITVDENRVNIASLGSDDTSGDAVTGGYLVELDNNFDEPYKFKSAICDLPYMFKGPDKLQPEQFRYFQNYINEMEAEMFVDDWLITGNYRDYIDFQSWIDRWFVYEICGNGEDWGPKSAYAYKDRGGKLMGGPVWDFDYLTFEPFWAETFLNDRWIYYGRMLQDPAFKAKVKERWTALKPAFLTIPDTIRTEAETIRVSNSINRGIWPLRFDLNGDARLSFDDSVERLVNYVNTKIAWLDSQFDSF